MNTTLLEEGGWGWVEDEVSLSILIFAQVFQIQSTLRENSASRISLLLYHLIQYVKCWHTSKSCTNRRIEVNNKVQCMCIIKSLLLCRSCCCCCCHHLNSLFFIVCRQTQVTADWYVTCCVSFLYHNSLKNNAMTKQITIDTYVKTAL